MSPVSSRFRWIVIAFVWAASLQANDNYLRLEADGVTVISSTPEKDATEFMVGYMAYRHAFQQIFGRPKAAPLPVTILLLKSPDDLTRLATDFPNKLRRDVALTAQVDGRGFLALSLNRDVRLALSLAYETDTFSGFERQHFYFPYWLQQGIAETLCSLKVENDTCVIGDAPADARMTLFFQKWLPWPEFSKLSPRSVSYQNGESFTIFCVQSWAATKFLLLQDPDKARERFFVAAVESRKGTSADVAISRTLGLDPNSFTSAVSKFAGNSTRLLLRFDTLAARNRIKSGLAPDWEVAITRASLMEGRGRTDATAQEFAKALAAAPRNCVVLEALAAHELRVNQVDAAVQHYRAAIAAGSPNPYAFLCSAQNRLDQSHLGHREEPGSGGYAVLAAIEEIRRARTLDPTSPQVYQLLGRACFLSPNTTVKDLDELIPGFDLPDSSTSSHLYHGAIAIRFGLFDVARSDYTFLAEAPGITIARRKTVLEDFRRLWSAEVTTEVERLVRAGEFEQATSLIDQRLGAADWPDLANQRTLLHEVVDAAAAIDQMKELASEGRAEDLKAARIAFLAKYPNHPATAAIRAALADDSGPDSNK